MKGVEELKAWKERLEAQGLHVSVETRHEVIESIYVRDPNGYFIEFTRKLRPLVEIDATDAALTLQAAIEAEEAARSNSRRMTRVDDVWARKAELLDALSNGRSGAPIRIYVPQVDEFAAIVDDAMARSDCRVVTLDGYHRIEADTPIEFRRKTLGLKPAVWYGLFTGGVHGRIEVLDRDRALIVPTSA